MTVNPGPGHEPGYDEYYQSGHTPPELRGAVERSRALDPFHMVYDPASTEASRVPPAIFWADHRSACVERFAVDTFAREHPAGWGSPDAEPMVDITDFLVGPVMLPRAPVTGNLPANIKSEANIRERREAMEREERRWAQLLARLPEVTITLEGFWDPELVPFLDPRPDLVHPFTD